MKTNTLLKLLLLSQTLVVVAYTYYAFKNDGADLFAFFLTNLRSLNWNGQFNLDFSCYLTLSGLWIMWRHKFSGDSVFIGLVAMVLGIIFFAPYILYLLAKEKGDLKNVFLGTR